jgi:prolyl-tRNA synthetase
MVVEAHSGAMGGSQSHEFMVASDAGEDFVAVCPAAATRPIWRKPFRRTPPRRVAPPIPKAIFAPEEFHTPGRKTIAEVAAFTGLPETSQMKSLVLVADGKPVLVMLRGDHQLSETKAGAIVNDPGIPPGASGGNPPVVRRRSRIARSGGREEHADPGRPALAGGAT